MSSDNVITTTIKRISFPEQTDHNYRLEKQLKRILHTNQIKVFRKVCDSN